MIEIRIATQSEFAEASAMSRIAFAEVRQIYTPIAPIPKTNPAAFTRIIARDAEKIVGTLQFEPRENALQIRGLAVHPEHRRLGIARQLIDFVAAEAKSRSLPALTLHTIKETGNVAIFERLGFVTVREEPDPTAKLVSGETPHDAFMQKNL